MCEGEREKDETCLNSAKHVFSVSLIIVRLFDEGTTLLHDVAILVPYRVTFMLDNVTSVLVRANLVPNTIFLSKRANLMPDGAILVPDGVILVPYIMGAIFVDLDLHVFLFLNHHHPLLFLIFLVVLDLNITVVKVAYTLL
jgi:hypothetical protein